MAVGGQRHAPTALLPGIIPGTHCTGDWVVSRASLDGFRKSRLLTEIRTTDRPARSESLYRLTYRGPQLYLSCNLYKSNTQLSATLKLSYINTSDDFKQEGRVLSMYLADPGTHWR